MESYRENRGGERDCGEKRGEILETLKMWISFGEPMCIDCKKKIGFIEDGNLMIGRCGCKRERLMTMKEYETLEYLENPVSQTIVLENLRFDGEWPLTGGVDKNAARDILDNIVGREFGDLSEIDRDEALTWMRCLRVMQE